MNLGCTVFSCCLDLHLELSHLWCRGVDGPSTASCPYPHRFLQSPAVSSLLGATPALFVVLQALRLNPMRILDAQCKLNTDVLNMYKDLNYPVH